MFAFIGIFLGNLIDDTKAQRFALPDLSNWLPLRVLEWLLNVDVDLQVGDAQSLPYPDRAFDDVIATFLFCSVPDPVLECSEYATGSV